METSYPIPSTGKIHFLSLKKFRALPGVVALLFLFCISSLQAEIYKAHRLYTDNDAAELIPQSNRLLFSPLGELRFISFQVGAQVPLASFFGQLTPYFPQSDDISYQPEREYTDAQGVLHTRYQQLYAGVPVEGAVFIVHSQQGNVLYANGNAFAISTLATAPSIDETTALENALVHLNEKGIEGELSQSESALLITGILPGMQQHVLAHKVTLAFDSGVAYEVYVSATDGKVLLAADLMRDLSMTATTLYDGNQTINGTYNSSAGMYETAITKTYSGYNVDLATTLYFLMPYQYSTTSWGTNEQPATSAHYAAEKFLDYFANNHGIYGYNDGTTPITVEVVPSSYDGAAYSGYFKRVAISYVNPGTAWSTPDIVGHELAHGILDIQNQLAYFNEYGAINESVADIGGALTEYEARGLSANWLMGEDVFSGGLRDMSNPSSGSIAGNPQPDTYRGNFWYTASSDNGGVHTNSGVGNYWFYLLTQGGSGSTDFGTSYSLSGIGRSKAANIVFYTVKNSMTTYTDFISYSLITEAAASTLYGSSSTEKQTVIDAWAAVEIPFTLEEDLFDPHFVEAAGGGSCNAGSASLSLLINNSLPDMIIASLGETQIKNLENQGNFNFNSSLFGSFGIYPGNMWAYETQGAIMGDIDNDGDEDLLVSLNQPSGMTAKKIALYRNDGGGTWTDVSSSMNLPGLTSREFNDFAFGDYNSDGYLDILVVGKEQILLLQYNPGTNAYVDQASTLPSINITGRQWQTCSWADVNHDGKLDAFITWQDPYTLTAGCFLLEQASFGNTFTASTPSQLPSNPYINSISWADLDNDLDLDMILGTMEDQFYYLKNPLNGTNTDWDLTLIDANYGDEAVTATGDFDNDGDLDIFATTGTSYGNNKLYENDGSGNFTLRGLIDFAIEDYNVNGALWEDMDNDGFLDLVLARSIVNGSLPNLRCPGDIIHENKATPTGNNHWMVIDPVPTVSNQNAYGARVQLGYHNGVTNINTYRRIGCKSGRSSQPTQRAHFGMADATTTNYVYISWPSGIYQATLHLDADQTIPIVEGQPYVEDLEVCYGTKATIAPHFLTSGPSATFRYYDASMNYLGSGTSFTTSNIYQTSTFYVSIYDPTLPAAIGPESPKVPMTVTLTPSPSLQINNGVAFAAIPITLDVDPLLTGMFSNYQWFKDGQPIGGATSPIHVPNGPGVYYVEADWTGCPTAVTKTSNEVIVIDDCVNGAAYASYDKTYASGGIYHFTSSTVLNNANGYVFSGTFYIDAGVTVDFQNTSVLMASCSEIIVSPGTMGNMGGRLIVNNTTIEGCGLWKGITVQGNPSISTRGIASEHGGIITGPGTIISDAELAVHSVDGGIVELADTDLKFNTTHVAITDYAYTHDAFLSNVTFDYLLRGTQLYDQLCPSTTFPNYASPSVNRMVYLENVEGVDFIGGYFRGNVVAGEDDPNRYGLETFNSSDVSLDGTTFSGHFTHASHLSDGSLIDYNSCYVSGDLSYGIHGTNLDNLNVLYSIFGSYAPVPMENGIYLKSSDNVNLSYNNFIGLDFSQYPDMTDAVGIGVQFYHADMSMSSNIIDQNLFDQLKIGLVVAPEEYPFNSNFGTNANPDNINLAYSCNKFWNNKIGVAGSGNIINQGDPLTDAGNMFYDPNQTIVDEANSDWDILWQGTMGFIPNYFYEDNSTFPGYAAPNTGPLLFKYIYTMNGIVQLANDKLIIGNNNNTLPCYGSWKKDPTGLTEASAPSIQLYPNLTQQFVFLKGDVDEIASVEIVNSVGQTITTFNSSTATQGLDLAHLSSGVYQVVLHLNNGAAQIHKVVVER